MGIPVMAALRDFMNFAKSRKSTKMLDFHQFWQFCWIWPHLEILTTPNRPDNVEKHEFFCSNLFKRLWNVRFRGLKHPRATLDGYARHGRTMRFHEFREISKIHQNAWFWSILLQNPSKVEKSRKPSSQKKFGKIEKSKIFKNFEIFRDEKQSETARNTSKHHADQHNRPESKNQDLSKRMIFF